MVIPNFEGGREVQTYYIPAERGKLTILFVNIHNDIHYLTLFSFLPPYFLCKHIILFNGKLPARVGSLAE